VIVLVPVGPVPADLLPWLVSRLKEVFEQTVIVAAGYDPRRRQYRGNAMIEMMHVLPGYTAKKA
jgi:hypothetical protein